MAPKPFTTIQDVETCYSKAAKAELDQDWSQAFRLYVEAAEGFLHFSRTRVEDALRGRCKSSAGKALERAEKIKALKHDLAPVAVNRFSEQEQYFVLKKSSLINGKRYLSWNESSNQRQHNVLYREVEQPELSAEQQEVLTCWQRPSEVLSEASMASLPLLPEDIIQHIVNDCSVCASIAVCLVHNRRFQSRLLLSSLFPQGQDSMPVLSPEGRYDVKIFVNGEYRRVIVDDKLPFNCDGVLIGLSTGSKLQLWPSVIEKAYMKLMGGYDFPGSNSGIDLHALAAWIPEHIEVKSPTFEREKTWSRIYDGFTKGHCVLTVGTDDRIHIDGFQLLPSHDYAVIDIREVHEERFLTLLDSRVRVDSAEKGCTPSEDPPADSSRILNMSWSDICGIFEGVYVSWNPDRFKYSVVFHGIWRHNKVEDKGQSSSHHLRLQLCACRDQSELQEIWILLTRHIVNSRQTSDYIALNVQNEEGNIAPMDINKIASKGTYTNSVHVLVRTRVDKVSGTLSILVSYDGPSEDVCFTVSAYSSLEIQWDKSVPSPFHSTKVDGSLTSKNAGGNCTYPTYMVNPQYHLRIYPEGLESHRAGLRSNMVIVAQASRDIPLNLTLVWSQGERTIELSRKEVAANSGAYSYGLARIGIELPAGDYTIILSAFESDHLGPFKLKVDSTNRFDLKPIPQEGAGMYNRVVRGEWNAHSAAGGPSHERYSHNPIYQIKVPSTTKFKARLQLVKASPSISVNLSLFQSSDVALGQCIATSGPYSDAVSGVDIPQVSLATGVYLLVPSTYNPGIQVAFRMILYSTAPGLNVVQREKGI
ncbi:hypothetical protein SERLA73DRAFT_178686 [Serpula lacrymans var. lacrymans S7.3]|uniref:Calpain catalytic domain-containing protein n=2 Tax=Serpula lacrymans var. lacrymans TaxID=341189 RepID=F8PSK4_SERL3|nr:uncharacterized protein SERLADRAFT_463264 [Serpula lacrymans var. lacrymans S7.9]EGO00763.1 hypothetical protein SERLA73DRAFT_178686 [Serpula lacrymans var. lacrymans S7.3]EGO26327.1 hypothetical protein SERLADRAFT_463264 [Serpula lacrymans var. lacrymans S7.9]